MHWLSHDKNYYLRLPDGRSLGHVRITTFADLWASGRFTPAAAFEEVRELFEKEAELRNGQLIPLAEQTADAIAALQIEVVEEGKPEGYHGWQIFVEGGEACLGFPSLRNLRALGKRGL